jgi:hypothetical protein
VTLEELKAKVNEGWAIAKLDTGEWFLALSPRQPREEWISLDEETRKLLMDQGNFLEVEIPKDAVEQGRQFTKELESLPTMKDAPAPLVGAIVSLYSYWTYPGKKTAAVAQDVLKILGHAVSELSDEEIMAVGLDELAGDLGKMLAKALGKDCDECDDKEKCDEIKKKECH